MKKVVIAVVVLALMTGAVGATEIREMRNQPLGWRGWVWGMPMKDVKGWLAFAGYLSLPYLGQLKVYSKQEEVEKEDWQTNYLFVEEKLAAIILSAADLYQAGDVIEYFGWNMDASPEYGSYRYWLGAAADVVQEITLPEKGEMYLISAAKGEYSSMLYLAGPFSIKEPEVFSTWNYIIIGTPAFVNGLINQVIP